MQAESLLQQQVCDYLRLSYPKVLFRSDFASGMKLTVGQAVRHRRLQSGRAWPDLFICAPRGDKHGLFLELKASGTRLRKRDGWWASDHLAEQHAVLEHLRELGFVADFAIGWSECKQKIDDYLRN